MDIPSRGSKEERIRIPCGYELIYRVTDIINKTELGYYVSVCVRYRVTWHASVALAEGRSEAVGARGEPGISSSRLCYIPVYTTIYSCTTVAWVPQFITY